MTEPKFRDRVVEAIRDRGWSMREAARKTGVSYDVIRELHRRPESTTSAENANKLEEALGLGLVATRVENGEREINGQSLVPVYDVSASAGFGALVDYEEQTHSLAFPPDYLKRLTSSPPQNLAIISVKGESMEPTLVDDDIVLVDMSKTHMGFEGLFVLRHNDTLLVKRAGMAAKNGHVMLISDNKAYPPVEAALADLNVIGKVLWYGRKV